MDAHKSKKRKGRHDGKIASASEFVDTSKPSAVFTPTKGRRYTLSVALPGSIIANAQTHDLKTSLAGQIARALAVFCVDEVIVFDDGQGNSNSSGNNIRSSQNGHRGHHKATSGGSDKEAYTGVADPDRFLAHLLSYLETPPHLRRHLFGLHPDLRTAGTLPSLDMPHHLRAGEWCRFREGVSFGPSTDGTGSGTSSIDVGFDARINVPGDIPEYARVTVEFEEEKEGDGSRPPRDFRAGGDSAPQATAVDPSRPREDAGYYWGYQVRAAGSLSAVITECPFDGGYDLTWGTSERGRGLAKILPASADGRVPPFNHMLVVFGGVAGLEVAAKADEELARMGVTKPEELFDYWVNLAPGQGSRTIRTEEAVWIGLMGLRDIVAERGIA